MEHSYHDRWILLYLTRNATSVETLPIEMTTTPGLCLNRFIGRGMRCCRSRSIQLEAFSKVYQSNEIEAIKADR